MSNKSIISIMIFAILVVGVVFIDVNAGLAISAKDLSFSNFKKLGQSAQIGTQRSIGDIITTIVNIVLGLLGIIFTVLIMYGGVVYMTAAGNQDRVDKGKKIISWAVIGLIIVILSLSFSRFIGGTLLFSSTGAGVR